MAVQALEAVLVEHAAVGDHLFGLKDFSVAPEASVRVVFVGQDDGRAGQGPGHGVRDVGH